MASGRTPIYKTILIGEGGVGKTSITLRYTEDRFDDDMKMTIGLNLASKQVIVDDDVIKLMIWDLGGQPRFREVVEDYYRGARMAIAVYDSTRYLSLEKLSIWIEGVFKAAPECDLVVVGNKIDERPEGSGVPFEAGQEFADRYNAAFLEVSAKTGLGVEELFERVAKRLIEKHYAQSN